MIEKIFLLGNPNVGKSVIFSRLTGVDAVSSNYPGTTIEINKGCLSISGSKIETVDLPGVYSLDPSSDAESIAVGLLKGRQKENTAVINVIDATNLERNLFLTLQLIEEGYRVIVCLNMCDDAGHRGVHIDAGKLEQILGVPVVSVCAVTGMGIKRLLERIKEAAVVTHFRLSHAGRWQKIGGIVETVQYLTHRHHTLRETLEDASVRPWSGLIISSIVIYGSFRFVRFFGEFLIDKILQPLFVNLYQPFLEKVNLLLGAESFLRYVLIGRLIDGKIDWTQSLGLLTTAVYIELAIVMPYIISFYFVLSLLEDTGYLPRLAILLDNLFHRLGLHGFAIIPVLLGFGCNVPGILATRALESKKERFIAATIISIGIPCVPLQAMIFGLLGRYGGFYVGGVYLALFSLLIILGIILNRALKGYSPEFLLEIPYLRFPPAIILAKKLYFRVKGFFIEAVPVVLIGILAVNIAMYFDLLGAAAALSAPVIEGLFGLPKEAIFALTMGLLRKDVAAGMLLPLGLSAKQLFISATLLAVSFPCIATFAALAKELGFKGLIKASGIMLITGVVIGTILNFGIR